VREGGGTRCGPKCPNINVRPLKGLIVIDIYLVWQIVYTVSKRRTENGVTDTGGLGKQSIKDITIKRTD
jgi:hypothetical protein